MPDRIFCLTDAEAALAAKGELRALVRKIKPQPQYIVSVKEMLLAGMEKRKPVPDTLTWIDSGYRTPEEIAGYSIFGKPGTVLLGKETWRRTESGRIEYKADKEIPFSLFPWRSPVTMPRFAIRHRFTVKESRACMAKDIKAGILLDTVGHSWQKLYEKYSETDWIWYAEVEKS